MPKTIGIFTRAERRQMAADQAAQVFAATGIPATEQKLLREAMGEVPHGALLEKGRDLGMTALETAVVTSFTRYASAPLNGAMRSKDPNARRYWAPLLEALETGIAKLPRARDVVAHRFEAASDREWTVGSVVTYGGVVSVSRKEHPGANVHLVMHMKDAGDISTMSAFPGEEELVTWSPSFRVVSTKATPTGLEVEVEQVLPESTKTLAPSATPDPLRRSP